MLISNFLILYGKLRGTQPTHICLRWQEKQRESEVFKCFSSANPLEMSLTFNPYANIVNVRSVTAAYHICHLQFLIQGPFINILHIPGWGQHYYNSCWGKCCDQQRTWRGRWKGAGLCKSWEHCHISSHSSQASGAYGLSGMPPTGSIGDVRNIPRRQQSHISFPAVQWEKCTIKAKLILC